MFLKMPALPRDDKMVQSIASLIRAKSKLLLLENPDTVEIYKVKTGAKSIAKIVLIYFRPYRLFLNTLTFKL